MSRILIDQPAVILRRNHRGYKVHLRAVDYIVGPSTGHFDMFGEARDYAMRLARRLRLPFEDFTNRLAG